MRVIARPALVEFYTRHPQARGPLTAWWKTATHARWGSLVDIRTTYAGADAAGRFTVFDLGGNKYRLVVRIDYVRQLIWIRHVLTHAEYDREEWKRDAWY